ncbi:MAG: hypothetical protein WBD22_02890 [Pyrinomonadaceae bacterium]
MIYCPKFCCECGEKIERIEWKLWTSRRFCDLCVTEHPMHGPLPLTIAAVIMFVAVFGAGSYFSGPPAQSRSLIRRSSTQADIAPNRTSEKQQATEPVGVQSQPSSPNKLADAAILKSGNLPKQSSEPIKKTVTPTAYFCGAMTKKGTPCSRKVRKKGRCWQHLKSESDGDTETGDKDVR